MVAVTFSLVAAMKLGIDTCAKSLAVDGGTSG